MLQISNEVIFLFKGSECRCSSKGVILMSANNEIAMHIEACVVMHISYFRRTLYTWNLFLIYFPLSLLSTSFRVMKFNDGAINVYRGWKLYRENK